MITAYVFDKVPPPVIGVTRDLRVTWALEETGLAHRLALIDGARGQHREPDYLKVNPFGTIPAIEDDGFSLFESGAILVYIATKSGKLAPRDDKARALSAQWAFAAVNTVEPPLIEIFAIDKFSSDQDWAKARRPVRVEQAQARLAALEKALAGKPFLTGDEFGIADILMTSVLRFVQHTDLLAGLPNVTAYKARCQKRPAFEKALHDHKMRVGGSASGAQTAPQSPSSSPPSRG
jgi:glutathione S-transferase